MKTQIEKKLEMTDDSTVNFNILKEFNSIIGWINQFDNIDSMRNRCPIIQYFDYFLQKSRLTECHP